MHERVIVEYGGLMHDCEIKTGLYHALMFVPSCHVAPTFMFAVDMSNKVTCLWCVVARRDER